MINNRNKILGLLEKWERVLKEGEVISLEKAAKLSGGIHGRIKRKNGSPVIFDFCSHQQQQKIIEELKTLMQESSNAMILLNSEPAIMDEYDWKRLDFIDLYYSHFALVIEKLRKEMN